ncbi:lipid II:glycine glycyltransferase FemX [Haloprofundus salilacus]|uniref:lipid II:glycine glycyltransferase FemX n=1 Tax=Haloprofundus salilacus TaxID=2876190 RepID=UPI001CCE2DAF|nr:GNAT family N-acetyltransferase [Haloprofundus salilacus]
MAQSTTPPTDSIEKHGVSIAPATDDELKRWNDLVSQSPHGTVYHRLEALEVQADHAGAELTPLVGYKGQEPICLFPLFSLSKAGIQGVFSPPPDLWVSYLGPALLNFEHLKQRRAEKRHRRVVEAAVEWIDTVLDPSYTHFRTACGYDDPRPFEWNEFDVTPRYTYHVDLSPGEEELLDSFSSDARQNVRTDADYDIDVEGAAAIERIIEQVRLRHEEQGESYTVTPEFVTDLYRRLPDGSVRPYVLRADDEFVGGMVTLAHDDTVYRWQGGAKTDHDLPVNDLLDWQIMRDAMERGETTYNLVGANNPRLCDYKAKFAPEVVQYHSLGRRNAGLKVAAKFYRRFIR